MEKLWLQDVYDDYHAWKGWSRRTADADAARSIADLLAAGITPPARLLEIGYGDGALLLRAKKLGYECHGVEIDDQHASSLRSHGIDIRTGRIDQFAGFRFDVIVAFDVFEHVEVQQLLDMLKLAHSVCADDGRLVARFPNMCSPFGLVHQYGDISHLTPLSPQSFVQLARLAGFREVLTRNAAASAGWSATPKGVLKALQTAARATIELALGLIYYGRATPLGPNAVVVLKRSDPTDT